jgi:pyruvate,water dikinase
VEEAGLGETIARAMADVSPGSDVAAVGAASDTIAEAMRAARVPEQIRARIGQHYSLLGGDAPVAVRSSALGEDSQDATFAGQQETYLWIRGAAQVCEAVRDCWISLYSPPAISYRARLGDAAEKPAMGVTVQRMVDAEVSGVMFTCNPVSGDPSMVAVNASWGLGLAVVGGEVTPDDYLVSKVTREVVRENVSVKEIEYVPGENGAQRVEVDEERREQPCLDEEALAALVEVGKRVERYFGSRQDIEWARSRNGELFVVQSRPVTGLAKAKAEQKPSSAMSLLMSTFGAEKKQ